ncbi:hypothetical protein [Desulfacinum hydrothermale]|uniref:hypothetical protein n=1 Tax=Desulfacinum hydrothermale TaxID=109258 RepID=UPI0014831154|nr:hypothetical protein [Desulfacinum hydrothermale]
MWQRKDYEHILRSEPTLNAVRRHIAQNPMRRHLDRHNPHATVPTLWPAGSGR